MIKELIILDNQKGSLRLLLILLNECPFNTRMELIDAAKNHGIAASAMYRILKNFKELDFITEKTTNTGQKITNLTSKGVLIAMQLEEIHELLYLLPLRVNGRD